MLSVCVSVCVWMLTKMVQIVDAAVHTDTCNFARTTDHLLMNSDRTPKIRSVWPTLRVKIARRKGHFHDRWASQLMGYLFSTFSVQSLRDVLMQWTHLQQSPLWSLLSQSMWSAVFRYSLIDRRRIQTSILPLLMRLINCSASFSHVAAADAGSQVDRIFFRAFRQ